MTMLEAANDSDSVSGGHLRFKWRSLLKISGGDRLCGVVDFLCHRWNRLGRCSVLPLVSGDRRAFRWSWTMAWFGTMLGLMSVTALVFSSSFLSLWRGSPSPGPISMAMTLSSHFRGCIHWTQSFNLKSGGPDEGREIKIKRVEFSDQILLGVDSGAMNYALERLAVNEATFCCPDELG